MAVPTIDSGGSDLYGFPSGEVARISHAVRYVEGLSGRQPLFPSRFPDRNYGIVNFRNDNAGTAPAYGVLRVTGTTIVDNFAYLTIDKPDTSLQRLYLVNGTEAVETGGYGWATWLWHGGQVLYDSGTPAIGESWGPKNSQWTLTKWGYGFTILGGNDTGLTTTIAVQQFVSKVRGKIANSGSSITKGGTGTVNVYDGNSVIMTSVQLIGVMNDILTVADTKLVYVDWIAGKWVLSTAECPVA